jgi:hypothetical protein
VFSSAHSFLVESGSPLPEASKAAGEGESLEGKIAQLCPQTNDAVKAMASTLYAQRLADAILNVAGRKGGKCATSAQAHETMMTDANRSLISNIELYKKAGQPVPPALSLSFCIRYRLLTQNMASAGCVGK